MINSACVRQERMKNNSPDKGKEKERKSFRNRRGGGACNDSRGI